MIYSNNKIYGRKIVKSKRNRKQFMFNALLLVIGICIGSLLIAGFIHLFGCVNAATKANAAPYGLISEESFKYESPAKWTSDVEQDFIPLDVPMDEETQKFIYYLSNVYDVDFSFIMAVIKTESGFNADVISATNDWGLMQINKINHEYLKNTLGVTDFLDPHQNAQAGVFILKNLFEKYDDPSKVLMAYNMGEGGASTLWEQGIVQSNYSRKVMSQVLEYSDYISERKVNEVD